jgi:hypothetical protein
MEQKEPSELTDEELLGEVKKIHSSSIVNALFIGFLIWIVIYSIVKNGFGSFLLFPLLFVYKLVDNSKSVNSWATN